MTEVSTMTLPSILDYPPAITNNYNNDLYNTNTSAIVEPSDQTNTLSRSSSISSIDTSRSITPTQENPNPNPGLAMAYYMQRKQQKQSNVFQLRVSPSLPDITESPSSPPVTKATFDGKLMSPVMKKTRPLSLVSNASNFSDKSNMTIGALKIPGVSAELDGTESVFDGSVFEGKDDEEDMWKAEKVLAGVRKRLDLFENNITRARDSLVAPAHSSAPSLDGSTRSGPPFRAFPISIMHSKVRAVNTHFRTVSEGAVTGPAHYGRIDNVFDDQHLIDAQNENRCTSTMSSASLSRADSTKQIRDIKDQMQDLKGKITYLTERTKRDSLRRKSLNNMRGTPLNDIYQPPEVTFNKTNISQTAPHSVKDRNLNQSNTADSGSECQTPRAVVPALRKSMSFEELGYDTAFSSPGEEPVAIVSYPRRNRVRAARSGSSSGSSSSSAITAIQHLQPPTSSPFNGMLPLSRTQSYISVSSYETALEDGSDLPADAFAGSQQPRSLSRSSLLRSLSNESIPEENDYGDISPNDDGYHSAPPTPKFELVKAARVVITSEAEQPRIVCSTTPTNSSHTHLINTPITSASLLGFRDDELSLKLPSEDRELVENLCEQLGKVCCRMELSESTQRVAMRQRLEQALLVLQGHSP